jgi:hypothetical protein
MSSTLFTHRNKE